MIKYWRWMWENRYYSRHAALCKRYRNEIFSAETYEWVWTSRPISPLLFRLSWNGKKSIWKEQILGTASEKWVLWPRCGIKSVYVLMIWRTAGIKEEWRGGDGESGLWTGRHSTLEEAVWFTRAWRSIPGEFWQLWSLEFKKKRTQIYHRRFDCRKCYLSKAQFNEELFWLLCLY